MVNQGNFIRTTKHHAFKSKGVKTWWNGDLLYLWGPTIVGAEREKIFVIETNYILGNGLFEYLISSK